MKTKHRLGQLTVLFISMILCIQSTAQEASKSVAMTRGGSDTTSQTLTLVSGWNWLGFNVLPTSRTVGDVLGTTGFSVNDIIQTSGASARFTGTSWTPESFTIEYGKLYQIYVAHDVEVVVNGVAAGLYNLPLAAGWNWIANSTLENAALSQLTHSGGWMENDRIQAAGGNSVAYINGKWISSAFTMESGKGYQIFAGNEGTLSFPATDEELYVVIDLSEGPNAIKYPVRYTNEGPNLDDDTCRTTELWLRKISKGTFIMGSPEDEVGRYYRLDMTQHEVTLTQDYYIGVFECTQRQWELVMGDNPSEYKGDCRPVECVSYNMIRGTGKLEGAGWPEKGHAVDTTSFMGKLELKTGLIFDLPTEAQWEYACRAGTTTALNSGKNLTSTGQDAAMDEVGRYSFNTSDGKGGYSEHTTVGSYLPNAWGLYDMHGNVWEWCLDWCVYDYGTTPLEDPVGTLSGSFRVTRGGSWYDRHFNPFGAMYCRSANRFDQNPRNRYYENGFRILCLPRQDLYVVVDLSAGPDAASYPVRYTNTAPNLDDDTCRTTELWLRKIPAGTFIMGSPLSEVGRGEAETPHEVTLTQSFYMGIFECTQRQWELVMGTKPSYFNNLDFYATRPVEQVSYDDIRGTTSSAGAGWPTYGHTVDATSFFGKLQAKTGLIFDLPTEAQWEYSCRAGTTSALNSGEDLNFKDTDSRMAEVGRYAYNGGLNSSQNCTDSNGTAKVGSYMPNAWGLYDMHGNVWEWILDYYNNYGINPVEDPQGPSNGVLRVLHSGSWTDQASSSRSSSRAGTASSNNGNYLGFRITLHPKQGLYAVVDLSGGPDAASYPVRYTNEAPNLDDDTCRTTELWLRKIPKGTFIMGSPEDEMGRVKGDMSQHEVTLIQDYYIGVFECTQRQWELVMGTRPSYFNNTDYYAGRPVEQVTQNLIRGRNSSSDCIGWPTYGHAVDSSSFMGKLQEKTGLVFDLPTEAQWEYACRAGTTTALNSGKNLTKIDQDANMDEVGRYLYNGGQDSSQDCDLSNGTAKVGSYLPNAWGLYDMHGNVLEWCLDRWGASTTSTLAETDPVGPNTGSYRMFRGGCWSGYAFSCRSAFRNYYSTSSNYDGCIGFRVLCLP